MSKSPQEASAREFIWLNRLRQRVTLERIVAEVGNDREKSRSKQFLEAMGKANPGLLEDIEQYVFDFFGDSGQEAPELFDESEYCENAGRKTALKLPRDIMWEEKIVRRAAREFRDLFHPCDNSFENAMKGLQYLHGLHSELFARARIQAIEQREQVLSFEVFCKCDCTPEEELQPAVSFGETQGRFRSVTQRTAYARKTLEGRGEESMREYWRFFLDRVGEVAPEMLD